jgi:beta-N-acetylhexosaminidase
MAHGWSNEDMPLSREQDDVRQRARANSQTVLRQGQTLAEQGKQQASNVKGVVTQELRARGRHTVRRMSVAKHRARRAYPATLLVVLSCLLGLLACDLSPSFLSALSRGANGSEARSTSNTELPSPGQYPPQKPLTFADRVRETVNYTLAHMTLDEKIGQMMMFETNAQSWNSDMDQMVRQMHAGAIIIYKKNMVSPSQLTTFISTSQSNTTIPMFVTMDEEGGNVDRLGDLQFNPPLPSASYLGSTGNPQLAYQAGARAAAELTAYGINTDLAPVVDVRVTPDQIEGPRLYGNDPATVTAFATAFMQGLQQNHIIACLKHWPGIGAANQDPHLTLPTIDRTLSQLESTEFAPFRSMLKDSPGMIMVTHVILSAVDPSMPSSLSPKIVQGILRDEMGYDGVIITDNLWMQGVSSRFTLAQAAVLAVQAGDDLLEGAWDPYHLRVMIGAIKDAVASGQISVNRIDQSVKRLLTLKAQYGILPLFTNHVPRPLPPGFASIAGDFQGVADLPRGARSAA